MKKYDRHIPAALCLTILFLLAVPVAGQASGRSVDTWIAEEYREYCIEIGSRYHISPELLIAIIERESSGRPDVSDGDCIGLMQISRRWHGGRVQELGVTDLYDPYSNILVAADYLAELFAEEEGDLYLVLMKYNMHHRRAEELAGQGIFSEYALQISERAQELERIHEREGGQP